MHVCRGICGCVLCMCSGMCGVCVVHVCNGMCGCVLCMCVGVCVGVCCACV